MKTRWLVLASCMTALCAVSLFGAVEGTTEEEGGLFDALHFTVTDHLIFSNAKNLQSSNPAPSDLFMHEDRARAEYDNYSLGVHFTNQFTTDGNPIKNYPFFLEKAYFTADWNILQVQLGDSYQELGRGIALSLFDNPSFGQNNSVQGAAFRLHPGRFELNTFGGRVNSITNPVAINPLPDPLLTKNFYIAAASTKVDVTQDSHLGAYYLASFSQPLDTDQFNQTWNTYGVTVAKENIVEGLDFYGETNLMKSEVKLPVEQRLDDAHATYASIIWSPAPFQLRLEGLDYRNYVYPFQRPLRLEDDQVAYVTTDNESVTRLYGEYRNNPSHFTAYSSMLTGWDRDHTAPIYHPIVGVKFWGPAHTQFDIHGGYRSMARYAQFWHGLLKFRIRTGKGQALELNASSVNWMHNLDSPQLNLVYRNIFNVTYTFSEKFNTTVGYEWVPTNTANLGTNFFNIGANYKVGALNTKGFVGQTSGGVQCSGGICRQVPPYSGAMVETTYVF